MALYKFLHRVHTGLLCIQSVPQLPSTLAHCKCRTLCNSSVPASCCWWLWSIRGCLPGKTQVWRACLRNQFFTTWTITSFTGLVMSSLLLNVPDNFHLQLFQSYQRKSKFTDRKISNFYCIWISRNRSSYFTSTHIHTLTHTYMHMHRHTL